MSKIKEFGAWAGVKALKNPDKYIKMIKSIGLDRIDLMINDGTKSGPFHIYLPENDLINVLKKFKSSGINVSITTWAKPEKSWIDGMVTVARIAAAASIDEIVLDLEEPWINPLKSKNPMEIFAWTAGLIGTLRVNYNGKIAIAPIVYCNKKVLDHAFGLVDTIIPQCYSTLLNVPGSGHDGSLESATMRIFSSYKKELVMGAAAWNLKGAYGYVNPNDALEASLKAVVDLGVERIRYWRFEFLSDDFVKIIKKYKD